MGVTVKSDNGYYSCWYTRLQGALYLSAFLTWGPGDAMTSLMMIEHRGIASEANFIVRDIIISYGAYYFILIKICFSALLIFIIPPIIQKRSHAPVYWMINGYLISFIIAGTLAMILNIQASMDKAILISPELVIFLFLGLILILTEVGEKIDRRTNPKIRDYADCTLNDLQMILTTITTRFKK